MYRAVLFIVDIPMMNPILLTAIGNTICQNRSPFVSECLTADGYFRLHERRIEGVTYLLTGKEQIAERIQGGAHKSSVVVSFNPIVLLNVGKKAA